MTITKVDRLTIGCAFFVAATDFIIATKDFPRFSPLWWLCIVFALFWAMQLAMFVSESSE